MIHKELFRRVVIRELDKSIEVIEDIERDLYKGEDMITLSLSIHKDSIKSESQQDTIKSALELLKRNDFDMKDLQNILNGERNVESDKPERPALD